MRLPKILVHIWLLTLLITRLVLLLFFASKQSNTDPLLSDIVLDNTDHRNPHISDSLQLKKITDTIPVEVDSIQVEQVVQANIEQYDLQTLDQDDVRSLFEQSSSLTREFNSVDIMEYVYKQTWDKDLLKSIIETLVQQYRLNEAYDYIKNEESNFYAIIEPHTALYILLNSELIQINKPLWVHRVREAVLHYAQTNQISTDDSNFYIALLALSESNLDQFISLVDQIQDPKYAQFKTDVQRSLQMGLNKKDLPQYYVHWLLSLDVMEYGYFKLAQQIAVQVLLEDDWYDLPYQVLAYSHFVLNNRERAIEYLLVLLEQETATYQENYKLLLGIAYYRKWDITSSVLYLSQLQNDHPYRADILRYLIQSYHSLWDAKNLVQSYQLLLANSQIDWADYYNFFEEVLYKPLVKRTEFNVAATNEFLLDQYIQTCQSRLSEKEQYICEYGQAWLFLYQNKLKESAEILETLTTKIEKSYIFAALWDYYHREGIVAKAQEAYTKAVALAVDEQLKSGLQQKLIGLLRNQ